MGVEGGRVLPSYKKQLPSTRLNESTNGTTTVACSSSTSYDGYHVPTGSSRIGFPSFNNPSSF